MAGLLRSSQAIVDQSVTTTNRLNDVSQSLPSRNSRPDCILPPRLSSSTSADAFTLQHHILALDTYFQDVLLLWSPGDAESAWKVSVANSSISQSGSRFTTWLELYGKQAGNKNSTTSSCFCAVWTPRRLLLTLFSTFSSPTKPFSAILRIL
ncbi:hypothetical protein C367_06667 [Cryptococcus neoformans Ze90-1]|nr:hypothetical protein C367_06667 [Cryptococcus neoformans var. grubii Ze90-1]